MNNVSKDFKILDCQTNYYLRNLSKDNVLFVAEALGDLCDKIVFVGGSVAQFYCDDVASVDSRPTDDVDCVVNLSTYPAYMKFCEELAKHKFYNDTTPGAPLCRFVSEDGHVIDVMTVENTEIGETNRWYGTGFLKKKAYEIYSGKTIYLLPVLYYLASKFDALHSRGGTDYRGSKDFEDIVYVLNTCSDLQASAKECNDDAVIDYLSCSFSVLLSRPNIIEEVECSLYSDEERVDYVLAVMGVLASKKYI